MTPRPKTITRRQLLWQGAGLGLAAALWPPKGHAGAQPRRGGTFRIPIISDPPHFDFQLTQAYTIQYIYALIGNRLVKIDKGPHVHPFEYKVVPDLAQSWEQPDERTYVFHLRRGVKWHHVPPVNGREFVADDVKFTIYRYLNPETGASMGWLYNDIAAIETPDKYTVKFRLKEASANFLLHLAWQYSWMMAREVIEAHGNARQVAVGTGPYILESYDRNVRAVFKRNPDYFETSQPNIDTVEWLFILDDAARVAAFRTGQIDIWNSARKLDFDLLQRTTKAQYEKVMDSNWGGPIVRVTKPPLNDARVRRALSLALDRDAMIKVLLRGEGLVNNPVPVGFQTYALPPAEAAQLVKRDVQAAKRLLAEAGHANGFKTNLLVTKRYGQLYIDAAQMAVQQWKDVGIEVDLKVVDYATFVKAKTETKDFDLIWGSYTRYADPGDLLAGHYVTGSGRNESGISDPKLDAMIREQKRTLDLQKRIDLIRTINRYLASDVNAIIPTFSHYNYFAWQSHLRGYRPHMDYGWPVWSMWTERT